MAVDVKWNLEEATEVIVFGTSITVVYKRTEEGTWMRDEEDKQFYPMEPEGMERMIKGYEGMDMLVMVFAPEKKPALKLGSKMKEVPIQKESLFDWDDVESAEVEDGDGDIMCFEWDDSQGAFRMRFRWSGSGKYGMWHQSKYTHKELKEVTDLAARFGRHLKLWDKNGEEMNYE